MSLSCFCHFKLHKEWQKCWEEKLRNLNQFKVYHAYLISFIISVSLACELYQRGARIRQQGNLANYTLGICNKIQFNIAAEESSVYCDKRLMLKGIINKTRKQKTNKLFSCIILAINNNLQNCFVRVLMSIALKGNLLISLTLYFLGNTNE